MKFKKVKIQAFRAYKNVEDGTFDFTIKRGDDNRIANFVSLYAPNGFGKTSFYDAVEFAFTNSIDRFLKNVKHTKDVAKSERSITSSKSGQFILRNRFSPDDLTSEIKLYTTASDNEIVKAIPVNKNKRSSDFHFDEKQVDNKYFQTVILSQEWIDAFLKVDDPADRYEKFMNLFGDTDTASYYKNLIDLINANEKKIADIKKRLTGIQKELDFNGDKDILQRVNKSIEGLIGMGEKMGFVEKSFGEKNLIDMSNLISERTSDLEFERTALIETIKFINSVFTGNDAIQSLEIFYNNKSQTEKNEASLERISKSISDFKTKQSLTNELAVLNEVQLEVSKSIETSKDIVEKYSDFAVLQKEISTANDQITSENNNIMQLGIQLSQLYLEETEHKSNRSGLSALLDQHKKSLDNFPLLTSKYNEESAALKSTETIVKSEEENLKQFNNQLEKANFDLKVLQDLHARSKDQLFIMVDEPILKPYLSLLSELDKIFKQLAETAKEFDALEKQVEQGSVFNTQLEKLIAEGLKIAEQSKETSCPLCSHEYENFQELSDAITANKILPSFITDLLNNHSMKSVQLSQLRTDFESKEQLFLDTLENNISTRKSEIEKIKNDKDKLEKSIDRNNISIEILKSSAQSYTTLLRDVTEQQYKQTLESLIEKTKIDIATTDKKLNEVTIKIQGNRSTDQAVRDKIKTFEQNIKRAMENINYKTIVLYFDNHFPGEGPSKQTLDTQLSKQEASLLTNASKIEEIKKEFDDLDALLLGQSQEILEAQKNLLEKAIDLSKKIVTQFSQEIITKLKVDPNQYTLETFQKKLEELRSNEQKAIEGPEKKLKEYRLLNELKNNVAPYLKFEDAKRTEADLKTSKSLLEKKIRKKLEDEKKNVINYLQAQVKSFFYEELINDLYSRIDPHPDYKKIKFICDFKEDKPKLNVCLYKDNSDDDMIIPNLYFSTAQLNILSLSIFLAKALNAKDDDLKAIECIFIDDPIQSMDSINVLSTIDLFRSLVTTYGKQIILSTHDENFHSLLKRKMPTEYFDSKFMELETFGKVKKESFLRN